MLAFSLFLLLGCSSELEVKGKTERFIGETITLALVEGDDPFSGKVELQDSSGAEIDPRLLEAELVDEKTLRFVVPAGTKAGALRVRAFKQGSETDFYNVTLEIARAALVMDEAGALEIIPLPPSGRPADKIAGQGPGLMALSPRGGLLYVAVNDELRFYVIESPLREIASIRVAGVTAVAPLPSGVLVATTTGVQAFRYAAGQGITQSGSLTLSNVRALSTDSFGERAAVLFEEAGEDRVAQLTITQTAITSRDAAALDTNPSARHVSIRSDGKLAVVADVDAIYQVDFRPQPPKVVTIQWTNVTGQAQPVAIARTPAVISGEKTDLFAIAEATSKALRMLGFDASATLKDVSTATLTQTPTHLSFGPPNELYIASQTQLFSLDTGAPSPAATPLTVSTTSKIAEFAVQP
jgi:hypothetical protein